MRACPFTFADPDHAPLTRLSLCSWWVVYFLVTLVTMCKGGPVAIFFYLLGLLQDFLKGLYIWRRCAWQMPTEVDPRLEIILNATPRSRYGEDGLTRLKESKKTSRVIKLDRIEVGATYG